MRALIVVLAACTLAAGCENMKEKVAESRQERCERADWSLVGERDGVDGVTNAADRYQSICGELFKPAPYQEGFQKGFARRPKPTA